MKRFIRFFVGLFLFLTIQFSAIGQNQKIKFGKPSKDDLLMTVYDKDPDADAVFLNEYNEIYYYISDYNIKLVHERSYRIKILKESGKIWANLSFSLRKTENGVEEMKNFKACAINLEGGKPKVSKVSAQDVKIGTIIDVKYQIVSDFIADIPAIDIQHQIPVRYSYLKVEMPDFLTYDVYSKAEMLLNVITEIKEKPLSYSGSAVYKVINYINEVNDIPAVKESDFVQCLTDHIGGIYFDIQEINFFDQLNVDTYVTWQDICQKLDAEKCFGGAMKAKNLFPEETAKLRNSELSDFEVISQIMRVIQNKVRWNGKHSLLCSPEGLEQVLANGIGNSADMNFLLYSALKDLGYRAFPVLLNPRYMGKMPQGYPKYEKINAFVLMVKGRTDQNFYVDASDRNAFVNVLPTSLLVDEAHYFSTTSEPSPISLANLHKNQKTIHMEYTFDDEKQAFVGTMQTRNTNSLAYFLRCAGLQALPDYVRTESENAVVVEEYSFEETLDNLSDSFAFDPYLSMIELVPELKEEDRKLPVEFDFPFSFNIVSSFLIPDGWKVKELPKSITMNFNDDDITFLIKCSESDGKITTQVRYNLNRVEFLPEDYNELKTYFAEIKKMLRQQIRFTFFCNSL